MAINWYVSAIAHTTKSQWNHGNKIGITEIRKQYGERLKDVKDKEIQDIVSKMHEKLTLVKNNIKEKKEVIMPDKPSLDKNDIRNAVEECLKSGKCDSFNTLSNNVSANKKDLADVKTSVQDGCNKLSSMDDLRNKIDKHDSIIKDLSLNNKETVVKNESGIDKLAVAALKTFTAIRDKESELTSKIESLINTNKETIKENNKKPVDVVKKDIDTNEKVKDDVKKEKDSLKDIPSKVKDDFITLEEALKHPEFADSIIKRISGNKNIKDKLMAALVGDKKESVDMSKDKDDIKKKEVEDDKVVKAIKPKDTMEKGVSILKSMIK